MSISRRPSAAKQEPSARIDDFIAAAPDSAAKNVAGIRRGNKQQISVTLHPELLVKMDQMARETGQSRAAIISRAVYELLSLWESHKFKGRDEEMA